MMKNGYNEKMKVALIDIGYDRVDLNEPLGITVLYDYIKRNLDVQLYASFRNIEDNFIQKLLTYKPDVVCVSTNIGSLKYFNDVYTSVRKEFGSVPIIVGGLYATYAFEQFLNVYPDVFCIVGEGEEAIVKILDNINWAKDTAQMKELTQSECPNLAFMDGGKLITTKRSVLDLSCMNNVPAHIFAKRINDAEGCVRMEASRGCPWNNCSYCVLKMKYCGHKWRPYPVEKVVEEMKNLSADGVKTVYFTDEEFISGDYDRMEELADKIISAKKCGEISLDFHFAASTSVKAVFGKYCDLPITQERINAVLLKLKEAGLRSLFLGIESGSDSQLRRYCKGVTAEQSVAAIELLNKLGIEQDIGYIIFDPLVTVDELMQTVEFLERCNLNSNMSRFAKDMRIVPFTHYHKVHGKVFKQFDLNRLEYLYSFYNADVQIIYDAYTRQEAMNIQRAHKIQGQIRELPDGSERTALHKELSALRQNEFIIFKALIETAIKLRGKYPQKEYLEHLKEQAEAVINTV